MFISCIGLFDHSKRLQYHTEGTTIDSYRYRPPGGGDKKERGLYSSSVLYTSIMQQFEGVLIVDQDNSYYKYK